MELTGNCGESGQTYTKKAVVDSMANNMCNWTPCPETGKPVWFWVVGNVMSDLSDLGLEESLQNEFIQRLKRGVPSIFEYAREYDELSEKAYPAHTRNLQVCA